MNKNIIILLYTLFTFNLLVGDNSASMDISFLDLPTTSRTASLGSTFLSDIGSPSNLLLNPSNIWFGDRVNSNKKFFKNLFLRSNITNYEIIGNNYYNVFGSIQFGNGITFGSGYIGIGQSDLNHYDSNANYLGEIKHTQNAYIFGSATRLLGINIGVSGAYIQTDFSNIGNFGNQDDIIVTSLGLSMNNKSINIDRSEIWKQILIPSKISLHVLSRNVISDISSNINISNNSLFKNIIGFRFDNDIEFFEQNFPTYFLLDYKSNNSFTDEQIDIGWGFDNMFMSETIGDLSFNVGLRNFSFNQISWGINYGINNLFNTNWLDITIGYTSMGNVWGGQTDILSIKYFYDKN